MLNDKVEMLLINASESGTRVLEGGERRNMM